jgi:hypothetical protein
MIKTSQLFDLLCAAGAGRRKKLAGGEFSLAAFL